MGALYKITFPNGRAYIGITMGDPVSRFRKHCKDAQRKDFLISRAIRKYGVDSAEFSVLLVSDDRSFLALMEKGAIASFGSLVPSGHNMLPGGAKTADYCPTADERQRRSDSHKGHIVSAETRRKMSLARLGKKQPASYSAKLSERNKGNNYNLKRNLDAMLNGRGVIARRHGKWDAVIQTNGNKRHLGRFATEVEAVSARKAAVHAHMQQFGSRPIIGDQDEDTLG